MWRLCGSIIALRPNDKKAKKKKKKSNGKKKETKHLLGRLWTFVRRRCMHAQRNKGTANKLFNLKKEERKKEANTRAYSEGERVGMWRERERTELTRTNKGQKNGSKMKKKENYTHTNN